jgi:O-acetyl-ADP-ribose deacetylase (regulator of RNase III)
MDIRVVKGDLLDQQVEVIVNPWNRNIIPWWLLIPQGVSGAIKKRGGLTPFRELSEHGPVRAGDAVLTTAGTLPFKAIIHVAGINMVWRSSEEIIRKCVRNAMSIATTKMYRDIAFPIIGSGSGGFNREKALKAMVDELEKIKSDMGVIVVRYR